MDEIDRFLEEDLNGEGDVTTNALFDKETATAKIIAKEPGILAGLEEAANVFEKTGAQLTKNAKDGESVQTKDLIATVTGPVKSILIGERLALNFLGRMSGIASETHRLVEQCHKINPHVKVAATRKTTPGFRTYEKKAVQLGGGDPHRFGLFDAVMIKDNHIAAKGSFIESIETVMNKVTDKIIEVEVEDEQQAILAAKKHVDVIMLDNFPAEHAEQVAEKIKEIDSSVMIEISGGITPETILDYVSFADRISMGYLTHTIKNKDFSLQLTSQK